MANARRAAAAPDAAAVASWPSFLMRGEIVMLDSTVARLFEVPLKLVHHVVRRNRERLADWVYQVTPAELAQIAPLEKGRPRYPARPYVFTECGMAMVSYLLPTRKAIRAARFLTIRSVTGLVAAGRATLPAHGCANGGQHLVPAVSLIARRIEAMKPVLRRSQRTVKASRAASVDAQPGLLGSMAEATARNGRR